VIVVSVGACLIACYGAVLGHGALNRFCQWISGSH
jgi:hypothetical protein